MSWAKLDDQLHAHRKAKVAWKAHRGALGLHLLALSYCAGHLTDGLVDEEFVEEKLPVVKERDQVTAALEKAGLWTREDDGWQINDWLEYNPSRAEVLDRRRKDSERKIARRQEDSKKSPRGVRADSAGSPDDPSRAGAFPDPTRPNQAPLSPPRGITWDSGRMCWKGRTRDLDEYKGALITAGRRLSEAPLDEATALKAISQAVNHGSTDDAGAEAYLRRYWPQLFRQASAA